MALILPKSVRDSKRFIAWVFPILLGFGIVSLPYADWYGRLALVVGMLVILTGWLSFGMLHERAYNDVLLVVDLSLLAIYWLALYYGRMLSANDLSVDATILNLSGVVFLLYSIWDVTALLGRDTAAMATAAHLKRFAKICFAIALVFFLLAALARITSSGADPGLFLPALWRVLGLGIWLFVLGWWHVSRVIASVQDDRG